MVLGLSGTALAYDGEITFQGIPWGSSFDDSFKIMESNGFTTDEYGVTLEWLKNNGYPRSGSGSFLVPEESRNYMTGNVSQYTDVLSCFQFEMGTLAEDKKIAGYDISQIEFSFVSLGDDTKLITAAVRLKWENQERAFDDLHDKLSSVYGEAEHKQDNNGIVNNYVWKGENNSIVLLDFGQQFLQLYYGTADATEWLEQAQQEYVPTNTVDSSDTSGL